jgi:sugar phosphate isomerase/epimerase
MMKLGIFAKTFAGEDPRSVLDAARAAGYTAVQYNMACSGLGPLPELISAETAARVRTASIDTGVEIAAISATYNMIHPDISKREAGRGSFEAIAANAHQMGSKLLTVCTGSRDAEDQWRHHPENESEDAWHEMIAEFRLLLDIAERYDILIGVEPELANVVSSPARAMKAIDELGGYRVRIVFDPANLFEVETDVRRREIIEDAVTLLARHIEIAHAKDRNADGSFATAGKGVVDFGHYVAALHKAGFKGALVTHGLSAREAPEVADLLSREISRA